MKKSSESTASDGTTGPNDRLSASSSSRPLESIRAQGLIPVCSGSVDEAAFERAMEAARERLRARKAILARETTSEPAST
jgi:hypothetical protein